jgi:hypothetical protein
MAENGASSEGHNTNAGQVCYNQGKISFHWFLVYPDLKDSCNDKNKTARRDFH